MLYPQGAVALDALMLIDPMRVIDTVALPRSGEQVVRA